MMEKLARFMMGRYGGDKMNVYLLVVGFVFSFLSQIFGIYIFFIISYVLWGYSIFRMFSRNISARQKEYYSFMKFAVPFEKWFKLRFSMIKQSKDYKYFKCPNCKQQLRAPKGRGKIRVRCQKCHTEFEKKV